MGAPEVKGETASGEITKSIYEEQQVFIHGFLYAGDRADRLWRRNCPSSGH